MDTTINNASTIIECEQRLLAAMLGGDADALDDLLHEDLLFNGPDGSTITKAMDMEVYRSGARTFSEMKAEEPMINLIDDIAVVSVLIEMQGKHLDQPFGGTLRYTRVWKLFDQDWKVVAGSCVPVA